MNPYSHLKDSLNPSLEHQMVSFQVSPPKQDQSLLPLNTNQAINQDKINLSLKSNPIIETLTVSYRLLKQQLASSFNTQET